MRSTPELLRLRALSLAWALVIAGGLFACEIPRERASSAIHPIGWLDDESPDFHGRALRASGYPLADCRACHGEDYGGGAVSSSCTSTNCHARGVEWCGTCHGSEKGPLPDSGAHSAHEGYCDECHQPVEAVRAPQHINGETALVFSGLAVRGEAMPRFDAVTGQCSDSYCHGAMSPSWRDPPAKLDCDGCHGAPPTSHARFARVAGSKDACASCHPVPPDNRHLDGAKDRLATIACDACHGKGPLGAPPVALDGSTDSANPGNGAHARHLDPTLSDRVGRVLSCDACHPVPSSIDDAGHLDTTAPADVSLFKGSYDPVAKTCVVACHWDKASPSLPVWTDASGSARACDACHGFPPQKTRIGTPHPKTAADLPTCLLCHTFDPQSHVDGHVDFTP